MSGLRLFLLVQAIPMDAERSLLAPRMQGMNLSEVHA